MVAMFELTAAVIFLIMLVCIIAGVMAAFAVWVGEWFAKGRMTQKELDAEMGYDPDDWFSPHELRANQDDFSMKGGGKL